MLPEETKSKIRWANREAWFAGNVDALDEVYAADVIHRSPPFPDIRGLPALKQFIAGERAGYSEIQGDFEDMVAEGDLVAYRTFMRMKHTGKTPMMPTLPPSGKELAVEGCVVAHLKDGKIVEEFDTSIPCNKDGRGCHRYVFGLGSGPWEEVFGVHNTHSVGGTIRWGHRPRRLVQAFCRGGRAGLAPVLWTRSGAGPRCALRAGCPGFGAGDALGEGKPNA
jgi:predicted ester cyclase